MNGTTVTILNKDLKIVEGYVELERPEGAPENQHGFHKVSNQCDALVIMTPIPEAESMPMGDVHQIVEGVHSILREDQGLIEVKTGATALMAGYAYSIIKTLQDPSGVSYYVSFDLDKGDHTLHIEGYFDEIGTTGQRETIILNNAIEQRVIDSSTMKGWVSDPYDKSFTRGQLMNLSEREEYDVHFPEHPLTLARQFVKFLISNN